MAMTQERSQMHLALLSITAISKCLVGLCLLETKTIYCDTLERFLLICMELILKKDDLKQKKHYPILEVTVSKAH